MLVPPELDRRRPPVRWSTASRATCAAPTLEQHPARASTASRPSPRPAVQPALVVGLPHQPPARRPLRRRPGLRRRRRRPHPPADRSAGHEHGHPGRLQPRVEARPGGRGARGGRIARELPRRAPSGRRGGGRSHGPGGQRRVRRRQRTTPTTEHPARGPAARRLPGQPAQRTGRRRRPTRRRSRCPDSGRPTPVDCGAAPRPIRCGCSSCSAAPISCCCSTRTVGRRRRARELRGARRGRARASEPAAYAVLAPGVDGTASPDVPGHRGPRRASSRPRTAPRAHCAYLIRPDGYVAYRAAPVDAGRLAAHLRTIVTG